MPPTTVSSVVVKKRIGRRRFRDWQRECGARRGRLRPSSVVCGQQNRIREMVDAKRGRLAHASSTLCGEAQLQFRGQLISRWPAPMSSASRDLATRKVISRADSDSEESKFNRLNAVVDQNALEHSEENVVARRRAARNSPGERRPIN